jgi:prepilin-type processing-associated H-X9-DG protein
MGECSYLRWRSSRTVSAARTLSSYEGYSASGITQGIVVSYPICRPNDFADSDPPQGPFQSAYRAIGYGSWHPGVCNFLLGDGSVRAVGVTTAPDPILRAYSFVDDGVSVALP